MRARPCPGGGRLHRWAGVVENATQPLARSSAQKQHLDHGSGAHRLLASRAAREALSSSAAEEQEQQSLVILLG